MNKNYRKYLGILVLCAFLSLLLPTFALAEYPEKPIQIIVAYAAGGGTDVGARIFANAGAKYFKVPLVIVNKAGAGGEIGFTEIARAKSDGYTIGFINQPTLACLPIQRKVNYTIHDFEYIINIADDPGTFAVKTDSPIKSLEDLIEQAQKNPRKIKISNAGWGADSHLSTVDAMRKMKISVVPVPFEGTGPARIAVLGGHVDAVCLKVGEVKPYVDNKQLRVLAVMDTKRSPQLPDVPTFSEKGFNIVMSSVRGLAGPKGMPEEAIKYIEENGKKTIEDPEFIELMKNTGIQLRYIGRSEYKEFSENIQKLHKEIWESIKK